MAQVDIERAFYTSFATLGKTYVSWPNGPKVDAPASATIYELSTAYGEGVPATAGLGALNRFVGFFQVNIRVPADGTGTYTGLTAAQEIADAYPLGSVLTYPSTTPEIEFVNVHCKVPSITHIGVVKGDESRYTIVVRIPWWADV